jgi:hypothetical protein
VVPMPEVSTASLRIAEAELTQYRSSEVHNFVAIFHSGEQVDHES